MDIASEKLLTYQALAKDHRLRKISVSAVRNRWSPTFRDMHKAQTQANTYARRHRALDAEKSTLKAGVYRIKNDKDLNDQDFHRSERRINELEAKMNPASSKNPV